MYKKVTTKKMNEVLDRIGLFTLEDRNGYILNALLINLLDSADKFNKYGFKEAEKRARKQAEELNRILTEEIKFYETKL